MKSKNLQYVVFLASLISSLVTAGPRVFNCVPTAVQTLRSDGVLVADNAFADFAKPFTVERGSGKVVGGLLHNEAMQISLVDIGSNVQSFKVQATTSTRVKHSMYLQINEFVDGDRKPFMGVRSPNSIVISGVCD